MSPRLDLIGAADVASGVLWAATYVLILRRGFLDGTSGAPLGAFAPAIAWELIFAVIRPTPLLPSFVAPTWLVLDTGIVYEYLRYGPAEERRAGTAAAAWFYTRFATVMAGAFGLEYALVLHTCDRDGAYSGFAVNVVMSVAFLAMLKRRRDVRGQSMYVAVGKLLGSALAIPHAYVLYGSLASLRAFMAATFLCDVAYVALLNRRFRALGICAWREYPHGRCDARVDRKDRAAALDRRSASDGSPPAPIR